MGNDADAAEPTELAGVAEAETESAHAWALESDQETTEFHPRRLTPGRVTGAAVATSLAIIAGATAIVFISVRDAHRAPKPVPPPVAQPSPAPSVKGLPPLLNGMYRLVFDWPKTTVHQSPGANRPLPPNPDSAWWAFSSTCTETACIATGTMLDNDQHQPAVPGRTAVLQLVNGVWQDQTPAHVQTRCMYLGSDGRPMQAMNWNSQTMSLELLPDGSIRGNMVTTVESDECGFKGDNGVTPVTAVRVGDVPPGVVANPPAAPPR